jgi:hypothetical protein
MFVLADDVLNGVALMTANNILSLRQSNCELMMSACGCLDVLTYDHIINCAAR